jgi:hypothetical protein
MGQKGRMLREELEIDEGILHIAQMVHCNFTGSSDGLDKTMLDKYVAVLAATLEDFDTPTNAFEVAVMHLCEAAYRDGILLQARWSS